MRLAYHALSWMIVALGVLHMLTTATLRSGTPVGRLWFFQAGVAIALSGVLNLLHRAYGAAAPGLRRVCIANNVLMTVLTAVGGVVTNAGPIAIALMLALVGGVTALSFSPRAMNTSQKG